LELLGWFGVSEDFSKISEVVTAVSSSGSDFFSSFLKPNQERNPHHDHRISEDFKTDD